MTFVTEERSCRNILNTVYFDHFEYLYIKINLLYVNAVNHQKSHVFSIQIYFGTIFLSQCIVCFHRYVI